MDETRPMDGSISKLDKERKKDNRGKPKGLPKSGGRAPGTPNKKTIYFSELLNQQSSFSFINEIKRCFDELQVQDRVALIMQLMPYVAPRLNAKDISDPEEIKQQAPQNILDLVK